MTVHNSIKQPLLSICIPTWNRAKFLEQSLGRFAEQIKDISPEELELYVSDNCSDDNTSEVVKHYIDAGLPITYNRNPENVGAARNFVKCMEWASGKYILLLGDDDFLKHGALKFLLDELRGKEYGLVHIHKFDDIEDEVRVYTSPEDFLMKISYWITFMSGSIFRKDIVKQITPEKYIHTHLLQVPYYITSALSQEKNLLIEKEILATGIDGANNGGYNFFEVFVRHYLDIWHEFELSSGISHSTYCFIKKDIYYRFVRGFVYSLLFRHRNVKDEDAKYVGNRKGFKIKGARRILYKYYGDCGYFYISIVKLHIRKYLSIVYHWVKR